ncbi:glycosyltransferase family 4 protein [Spirochaetota bacterium]
MKTAVIHEWFDTIAGSEKVLEEILRIYTGSDLYSLVDFIEKKDKGFFADYDIHTSLIQRLPFARKKFRSYLALFPFAIEQFDLSAYDLIISNSHSVAKGIITAPGQAHISYIHSPMRYAWDLQHQYLQSAGLDRGLKGMLAKWMLHKIRIWDSTTANRVDYFIANSNFIKERIRKAYGRDAHVIYPPVDISAFSLSENKKEYYLAASRLVPYKKMDIVVEAFASMPEKKLIVIGEGPEMKRIKALAAKSSNIELLGYLSTSELGNYLKEAKAFIFPAIEDFGMLPVEAQACGTPVIAFGRGGALETVIEQRTGIFFHEQHAVALKKAVAEFEKTEDRFDSSEIRRNAERFSKERFRDEFKSFVDAKAAELLR